METVAPRKVIAKVDVRPNRPTTRPVSPFKQSQLRASPSPDITRPRAKVSTSATQKRRVSGTGLASTIGTSPAVSPGPRSPSTIPRPVSPSKYSPAISRVQSAHSSTSYAANDNSAPRAKATLSQTALSRQRSLTGSALSPTVPGSLYTRERRGSTSSSLSASQHLSPESAASASPALRVKSKVTSLAKTAAAPSSAPTSPLISRSAILPACHPSDPSSPSYTTTRPVRSRVRSPPLPEFNSPPSASSVPSSPAIPYSAPYPLSNGTNTHGNGASHSRYQSFSGGHTPASDSSPVLAKVDPAALPPLPQSPPASTTSFSSHSSRSSLSQLAYSSSSSSAAPTVSSVAGASRVHSEAKGDPPGQRAMFDALVDLFDPTSAGTSRHASLEPPSPRLSLPKSEGSQIRAAAKSNRKIEDLEITNRSLLAINSTLEAAKHKQAKEIRELRRRLRESRLILPPRTFRAVKSSQPDLELEEDDDDDEEDEEDLDNVDAISANDEAYKRVRSMIDGLLEVGRRALESTPEEHIGPKVLSAEEARPWRDEESFAEAGDMSIDRDQDPTSEDEVEATLDGDVPSILVGMS